MHSCISSAGREVLCALAGPLGGFLLLFLLHSAPRIALCAFVQSVCNLIPVYPLDGGRALYGFLSQWNYKGADAAINKIGLAVLSILLLLAVWISVRFRFGVLPMVVVLSLIVKARKNTLQRKGVGGTIVLPDNS